MDFFKAVDIDDLQLIQSTADQPNGCCHLSKLKSNNNARDNLLQYAIRHRKQKVFKFLLESDSFLKCFNVNARNDNGDAAIHLAATRQLNQAIKLLSKAGANVDQLGRGGDNFSAINDWKFRGFVRHWYERGVEDTALHQATRLGYFSTVTTLLDEGADIDKLDSIGSSLINIAAAAGRANLVEFYLKKGLSIEAKDNLGRTPFLRSAQFNRTAVVRFLIENEANTSEKDFNGDSALNLAAKFGGVQTVQFLLEKLEFDIEQRGLAGRTALLHACAGNNVEVAKFLQRKNCNVMALDDQGNNALHLAAAFGSVEAVKFLIYNVRLFDVEVKNSIGLTPLNCAIVQNNIKVVQFLLGKNANTSVANNDGDCSIHLAATFSGVHIFQLLVNKRNVDIELKGLAGRSAFLAAVAANNVEVARFLEKSGADVMATDSDGNSALNIASAVGGVEIVRVLIEEFGFGIETKGWLGRTPFLNAASGNNVAVAEFLHNKGADVKAVDDQGNGALNLAALFGDVAIIRLLIEDWGLFDIETKGYKSRTPLLSAAEGDNADVVRYLCNIGADIKAKDSNDMTALDLAEFFGAEDIAEILKQQPFKKSILKKY